MLAAAGSAAAIEVAQHSIRAWNALRMASSIPLGVTARSVRRIDGPHARTAIGTRVGIAGVEIGILDAIEKPPRSGGLTLLIAVEGAVAETRVLRGRWFTGRAGRARGG